MRSVSKRNVDYFELFTDCITLTLNAAIELQTALSNGIIQKSELKRIGNLARECDILEHQCLKVVDTAFITPIDRADIVELVRAIAYLTNSIDTAANMICILQIKPINTYLISFAECIVKACRILDLLIQLLKQHKKNREKIKKYISGIKQIKKESTPIFIDSIERLFTQERDTVRLIKQKDAYELLIAALDRCMDIVNIVETIVVAKF